MGRLAYFRTYSGTIKAGSRAYNVNKEKRERIGILVRMYADHRDNVEEIGAGDIGAVLGLKFTFTGDTLCTQGSQVLLESITFPETVISMAIEPETSAERKKLATVLDMMKRQDPTFRAKENEETGQTLISGMGELHLEVIKHRLLREHKLNVRVHKPRVSYRETVQSAVEVTGQCHRTMAGQTLFAELTIRMEPFDGGAKPVTVLAACGRSCPGRYWPRPWRCSKRRAKGAGCSGSR